MHARRASTPLTSPFNYRIRATRGFALLMEYVTAMQFEKRSILFLFFFTRHRQKARYNRDLAVVAALASALVNIDRMALATSSS